MIRAIIIIGACDVRSRTARTSPLLTIHKDAAVATTLILYNPISVTVSADPKSCDLALAGEQLHSFAT
jgi:hypothetical protein